jgi:hypothetical protein
MLLTIYVLTADALLTAEAIEQNKTKAIALYSPGEIEINHLKVD